MTKSTLTLRDATVATLMLAAAIGVTGVQGSDFAPFGQRLDRTGGEEGQQERTASLSGGEFEALAKMSKACLNFAVFLDGKSDYNVLFSTEELDIRDNVECVPGGYGPLPMGDGVEYYIRSESEGQRMDLSVLPGSRSLNPYNDVVCVPGGTIDNRYKDFAALHIRGFFVVLTNDFGDFSVVQLRPPANQPTDEEVETCLAEVQ